MTDTATVNRWIEAYLRAWESNSADDIGRLFTDDAVYLTEPFSPPVVGRQAIVDFWLDAQDAPDDWTFEWNPVALEGDTAVIEGRAAYSSKYDYRNIWVIGFAADGRAHSFTEWYMVEPDSDKS